MTRLWICAFCCRESYDLCFAKYGGNRFHPNCLEMYKAKLRGHPADECYGEDPQCPYCGYKVEELEGVVYDLADADGFFRYNCPYCRKTYLLSGEVSYEFTSKPMEAGE